MAEKVLFGLLLCMLISCAAEPCPDDPCQNGGICSANEDDEDDSFSCTCSGTGWTGDTCETDIDECIQNDGRGPCQHKCTNTDGSFTCRCDTGYTISASNSMMCVDIDECTPTDGSGPCDQLQDCNNSAGSFTCSCTTGYSLNSDDRTCDDIDECAANSGKGSCQHACSNTDGSFECSCDTGYTLTSDGRTCDDINECSSNGGKGPCQHTCANTDGSFTCSCDTGYTLNRLTCDDIDECAENGGRGSCEHTCTNTVGSFTCGCNNGYNLNSDGLTCDDINECDENGGKGSCEHTCTNKDGSFECSCDSGYTLNSNKRTCNDIDECASNGGRGLCEHTCTNRVGSFTCSCTAGYNLNSDGRACDDIDECVSGPCDHTCANTGGSFTCSCHTGYTLNSDGRVCDDIDECASNDGRGRCQHVCANSVGSFTCSCDGGFTLNSNSRTCDDIDECAANGGKGPCQHRCSNSAGSFMCRCNAGYRIRQDRRTCADINECAPNGGKGPCQHACTNSVGSFTCSCDGGYALNADGMACDDIDECAPNNGKGPCQHKCTNSAGSFTCSCHNGYSLTTDRQTCSNVNECSGNPNLCSQNCTDNEGGYTCSCWEGYKLHTNAILCIAPADITPSILSTTALSSTSIRLWWSIPLYPRQITAQYLYVNVTENTDETDGGVVSIHRGSGARSFRVNNLIPYTNYAFWVVATINDFRSNRSEPTIERTLEGTPTVPQNVQMGNVSWHELRVAWEDPERFYGPNAGYFINLYSSGESSNEATPIGPVNSTEYVFSGLRAATEYTVEVQAYNGQNNGPAGNDSARTSDGFPSPPTNLTAEDGESHCTVTWSPPMETKGTIHGYRVHIQESYTDGKGQTQNGEYSMRSTASTSIRLLKSNKTEILDLLPNSVYTITVTGFTYTGEGNFSRTVNCTVPPGKPSLPGKPRRTQKPKTSSFALQIRPASERNGPVRCYHVIVIKTDKNSTEGLPEPEKLQVYKTQGEAEKSDLGYAAYIAMARTSEQMKTSSDVTLGDGSVTSCKGDRTSRDLTADDVYDEDYVNSPLTPDSFYATSVRAYGPKGDDELSFSASQYTTPTKTAPPPPASFLIPIIAAVCAAVLLAIIIIALVCCLRRRKRSRKSKDNPQYVPAGQVNDVMAMADLQNDGNDDDGNIYVNVANVPQLAIDDPVPADRLEEVFNDRHANDDQIFREEYGSIGDKTSNPHEEYQRPENYEKNRFKNIYTYDHSRVVLSTIEGEAGSDYINANYVDGYNHSKKFIAAQGPLETTVDDFWRMIWEQDTATIVMVTHLVEKNKRKCTQYWPVRDSSTYGTILVTLEDTTTLVDYVIRTFTVKQTTGNSPARAVTHFHFTSWPDHGVPQSPLGMMKFIRRVKTSNPRGRGPIIVHCSAGVGRTGTFIAIETMQEVMAAEERVDVHGFIGQMRHNRHSMVQTEDQYVFIYRALLEQHLYGDTEVEVANIHRHMHKLKTPSADPNEMGYEAEFKKLTRIPIDQDNMRAANKPANKSKNRVVTTVPYDTTRVFLPRITGVKDSDYINASFIDGYRQKDGFLATQGPLPNTVDDFWRLVWEWKSYSIVMLTRLTENGKDQCHQYWPDGRAEYGKISVELKETEKCPSFILRTFHVGHTENTGPPFRVIRQFHFRDWPCNGVPENGGKVLDLIGKVEKQQQQSGNGPITVHCSSGAGRTGAFISLNTVLERVKAEGICDLFQTVKSMRYSRPHMVQTADQYLFCYQAVVEYLDSFDNYANFQ